MKHFNTPYPFSAIVGQERMKKALLLNAINPRIGGVLIKGEKGTAKSTAVRALSDLLPEIEVVQDCVFGCNPDEQNEMCEQCLEKFEPTIDVRKMKVIDLPLGSTEDRVVGTMDIEHAIKKGEKKFEPGILALAHRNILYVDEVNLLDDHIVDVLLDAAAMGVNIIEREGISYSHPSSFILVGTMNPEEGELRPQLLDRFGLCAEIEGINDAEARVEIIKRRMDYEKDPEGFAKEWGKKDEELRERIVRAKGLLPAVKVEEDMLKLIARICINMAVDGHRADIAMMKTAATIAAYHQRNEVTEEDVKEAAELVLPHRMRRKPFSEQKMEQEKLEQSIQKHKEQKQKEHKHEHTQNQNPEEQVPDASSETLFEEGEPFKVNQTLIKTARKHLQSLPTGGKTPLSQGLVKGYEVLNKEKELNKNIIPLLILLSDGKANVSMGNGKPVEEAKQIASLIKASGIKSLVIDAEQSFIGLGFAQEISSELGARYMKLEELRAQDIVDGIRDNVM